MSRMPGAATMLPEPLRVRNLTERQFGVQFLRFVSLTPGLRRVLLGLLPLVLLSAACTEEDVIFDQVGTARIFFVDSRVGAQSIDPLSSPIQEARWKEIKATLTIGDTTGVLEGSDNCIFLILDLFPTFFSVGCSGGLVLDASGPQTINVDLEFSERRARSGLEHHGPCPVSIRAVL